MNKTDKIIHKNNWEECFLNNKTLYHITISYCFDTSEQHSDYIIKKIIKMVHKDYYGNNKEHKSINGYVVKEKQKNDRPHCHILIGYSDIFSIRKKYLPHVFLKKCKPFNNISLEDVNNLTYKTENLEKRNMYVVLKEGLSIQNYYYSNLENYLTKEIKNHKNFDFIKPITSDGF